MKVAMYLNDKGGLKTYSKYLVDALKKNKLDIQTSNDFKRNVNIYHIQFESSLFHPFGLGVVPKIFLLRLKRKKVVLTMHTVLSKNNIYSRNGIINFAKKIILPITNRLICTSANKVIVHRNALKDVLVNEYGANKNNIEVIAHGAY